MWSSPMSNQRHTDFSYPRAHLPGTLKTSGKATVVNDASFSCKNRPLSFSVFRILGPMKRTALDYRGGVGNKSIGFQKGWSSERVSSNSRRHIDAALFSPFNSGRALPSKWEDAERWICSPVSGSGGLENKNNDNNGDSISTHIIGVYNGGYNYNTRRRPKSKSGPLGQWGHATAAAYYSNFSPGAPVLEGSNGRTFMVGSPFSTGVLVADEVMVSYVGENGGKFRYNNAGNSEPADLLNYSNPNESDDTANGVSRAVSRRDMGTQMSPKDSICTSPKKKTSYGCSPTCQNSEQGKLDVRDVLMDKRSDLISWSKRYATRITKRSWQVVEGSNKFHRESQSSSFDSREAPKNMSRLQREEAKIVAWENLQKAKAEAAIRKLEMNLEKKRSSSMEKILNKLRKAEIKAQEMRSSISREHHASKTSYNSKLFPKHLHANYFQKCFRC